MADCGVPARRGVSKDCCPWPGMKCYIHRYGSPPPLTSPPPPKQKVDNAGKNARRDEIRPSDKLAWPVPPLPAGFHPLLLLPSHPEPPERPDDPRRRLPVEGFADRVSSALFSLERTFRLVPRRA